MEPIFLGVVSGGVLVSGAEEGLVFEKSTGDPDMADCPPEKITRGIHTCSAKRKKEFHAANGFILKSDPYTCNKLE